MEVIVIGIGRIGSVAACCLADAGHNVMGIEINVNNLEIMNAGLSPYHEPELDVLLKRGLQTGNLKFTKSLPKKLKADVVMIAVNTPSMEDGACDLSYVYTAMEQVKEVINGEAILVMKSTVPSGTGVHLVNKYLQGTQITYVSNPEFLRAGQGVYDWNHPDRIVIGTDNKQIADSMRILYSGIDSPMLLTDITSAEMIKCASNSFLATKISFINEIANICEVVGANIDDVSKGIGLDPRIGSAFLQAGLGYGGPCLPKDTAALYSLAKSMGYDFKILEATIDANKRQRMLPVSRLKQILGFMKGKDIALLGLSFKPGTSDVTGSPSLDIARMLVDEEANLWVYDPAVTENSRSLLPEGVVYADDIYSATANACAIILATEWPVFIEADWARIKQNMVQPYAIFDGRNALPEERLVALGFKYFGVGRRIV